MTAVADYAQLRRQAIGHAQAASGDHWTDYNLHDPGVTLLEQTCFALTEVAYRARHDIRDLLTGPGGRLDFEALGLFGPARVLPTAPVTAGDLARRLSDARDIAHVHLTEGALPGLVRAEIIPAGTDIGPEDAEATVRNAFAAARPLCTVLEQVRVATPRRAVLSASVEMAPDADPDRIAAEIYFLAGQILRGRLPGAGMGRGATRADVYDDPAQFWRPSGRLADPGQALTLHLTRFRRIDGVHDISAPDLTFIDEPPGDGAGWYATIALPRFADQVRLALKVGGQAVHPDPARIKDAFLRASADSIAHAHHHLDDADWQVMSDGKRREFTREPTDATLPAIYRIYDRDKSGKPGRLAAYRAAIDGHLDALTDVLGALPDIYRADPEGTPEGGDYRQAVTLLDLLIGLQGDRMPDVVQTGLAHYLPPQDQLQFGIDWRLRYLRALPDLNAARGTAPLGADPGGFMARLGLLADLAVQGFADLPQDAPRPVPGFKRRARIDPARIAAAPVLSDMLVPEAPVADPMPFDQLAAHAPFSRGNRVSPDHFRRAADGDAFAIAPDGRGGWMVLFDPGGERRCYLVARGIDRDAAMHLVRRLRAGWRGLHRTSERAILIEDILLRSAPDDFAPNRAWLVLTGWTARTALPEYRRYIADLVARHAPAHLYVQPLWLSLDQMEALLPLCRAALGDGDARAAAELRRLLGALVAEQAA